MPHVDALADPTTGWPATDALPHGLAVAGAGGRVAAARRAGVDLHTAIDTEGRTSDRREDFDSVYGDWESVRERGRAHRRAGAPRRRRAAALRAAERDPAGAVRRRTRWRCCTPTAPELDALAALADDLRRDVVGDDVTYVVNRNINFTNVCYTGCRFCAFAQRRTDADAYTLSLERGRRPGRGGLGARRHRGLHAGRHPPRPARHRLLRHRRAR